MHKTEQNFIQSNVSTAVCRLANKNGKKAVYTEHAQNFAHFAVSTMIGIDLRSALAKLEHIPQVVCVVHTGMSK